MPPSKAKFSGNRSRHTSYAGNRSSGLDEDGYSAQSEFQARRKPGGQWKGKARRKGQNNNDTSGQAAMEDLGLCDDEQAMRSGNREHFLHQDAFSPFKQWSTYFPGGNISPSIRRISKSSPLIMYYHCRNVYKGPSSCSIVATARKVF